MKKKGLSNCSSCNRKISSILARRQNGYCNRCRKKPGASALSASDNKVDAVLSPSKPNHNGVDSSEAELLEILPHAVLYAGLLAFMLLASAAPAIYTKWKQSLYIPTQGKVISQDINSHSVQRYKSKRNPGGGGMIYTRDGVQTQYTGITRYQYTTNRHKNLKGSSTQKLGVVQSRMKHYSGTVTVHYNPKNHLESFLESRAFSHREGFCVVLGLVCLGIALVSGITFLLEKLFAPSPSQQ